MTYTAAAIVGKSSELRFIEHSIASQKAKAEGNMERRGPLRSTGYGGSTQTTGRMVVGPCESVDGDLIALLAEATRTLYAVVGAARTLNSPADRQDFAIQEILVASMAIAATEAESLVTLCSIDLCAPARIHARALGDIARRCLLLPRHPEIALEMYDALEASRKELVKRVERGHPVHKVLDPLYADVDGATMETVERRAYSQDDQSDGIFMAAVEKRLLSKWNHADIVALTDAGERLLITSERIRYIAVDPGADLMIHRALAKVLAILCVARDLFGVEVGPEIEDYDRRQASFVERFRIETEALKANLSAYLRGKTPLS